MLPLFLLHALSTTSLTAQALMYTQPYFLLGMRMTVAGVMLMLCHLLYHRRLPTLRKEHAFLFVQVTIFAIFLPYCLRYWTLHISSPAMLRIPLLYNLGPIITYGMALLYAVEQSSWHKTFALFMGLVGLIICLGQPIAYYLQNPLHITDGIVLLSLISFSYGWIIIRKLIIDHAYSPLVINAITMFGGGLLGLIAALSIESQPFITEVMPFAVLLMAIIFISNCIAHNLYASLFNRYSLTLLQVGSWLVPVFKQGMGICLLEQPLTFSFVLSSFLIIMSCRIYYVSSTCSSAASCHVA